MSDLMPTITDRTVPTHWDFEESVRRFVEVKEKALTSLSDLGREIWVAYKKTEGSRGGVAYGDAYRERFTFKAWCEAAGISRWAGMRAVRKYDPAIDANLRAQNAARKAALDAPLPRHQNRKKVRLRAAQAPLSGLKSARRSGTRIMVTRYLIGGKTFTVRSGRPLAS